MTTVLIILAVVIVGLVVAALSKSNEFRVTRSIAIKAPTEQVFALVNNLHSFQEWSPWAEAEPEAHIIHEGPASGVGAVTRWEGRKTGKGIMTITESRASENITMRLEFLKPMKSLNRVEFAFLDCTDHTDVSWTMIGPNPFIAKLMSLFINCEKMCGDQFEHGLRNLKARAERENP